MVAAGEKKKKKMKEDETDEDEEELTDFAVQPTAAFGEQDADEQVEKQPLNSSNNNKSSAVHDELAASAALVSQESHFYAGEKDGDYDDDDDDEDSDSDLDEEEKADKKHKKKLQGGGESTAAPSPDRSVKYQVKGTTEQEEEELAKTRSLLKEAVGDLKINVRSARGWQRLFNQMAIFCAVLATGFGMGAVLSPKWVYISPNSMSSALGRYSVGLLAECDDNSCTTVDHNALLINNTCGRDTGTLRARLGISAVFYLAAAIFAVPLYFTASRSCISLTGQKARKIFTGIVFGMTFFAVVISMQTFDSWINCDIPWCEAFLSTNSAGNCEYGFMFGSALVCIILSFGLVMMNIIQTVCRPCGYEEKRKSVLDAVEDQKQKEREEKKYAFKNVSSSPSAPSIDPAKPSHQPDANDDDEDEDDGNAPPPQVVDTPKERLTVG